MIRHTLWLSMLLLGCREPNPDWMGPVSAGDRGGDTSVNVTGGDNADGESNDTADSGSMDVECADIGNRNACTMNAMCMWVGNPGTGECQPA